MWKRIIENTFLTPVFLLFVASLMPTFAISLLDVDSSKVIDYVPTYLTKHVKAFAGSVKGVFDS